MGEQVHARLCWKTFEKERQIIVSKAWRADFHLRVRILLTVNYVYDIKDILCVRSIYNVRVSPNIHRGLSCTDRYWMLQGWFCPRLAVNIVTARQEYDTMIRSG